MEKLKKLAATALIGAQLVGATFGLGGQAVQASDRNQAEPPRRQTVEEYLDLPLLLDMDGNVVERRNPPLVSGTRENW